MGIENLEEELKSTEIIDEKQKLREKLIEKSVRFMNEIRRKYGDLIKAVVIFGSVARGDLKKGSDVDIWVILDDTISKASTDTESVVRGLYLISESIGSVHVQTTSLTDFWQWIKLGSPELINYLKYGLVIYDTGFVKPIQRMLSLGLLPPSEEAVSLKAKASILRLKKIQSDIKSLIFDLRYSASDMIQAVIMQLYKAQPDQKEIPNYLEKLVKEGKLEEGYIEKWKELDELWKKIDHEEIKEVDSTHLALAEKLSKDIIERFKSFLSEELIGEKLG